MRGLNDPETVIKRMTDLMDAETDELPQTV